MDEPDRRQAAANNLIAVLTRRPVATIDELKAVLQTDVRMTVYRVLKDIAYSARISDLAMVLDRQDKSPRLDCWGSDVRSHTTEGDTQWVNYKPSPFSSPSMAF